MGLLCLRVKACSSRCQIDHGCGSRAILVPMPPSCKQWKQLAGFQNPQSPHFVINEVAQKIPGLQRYFDVITLLVETRNDSETGNNPCQQFGDRQQSSRPESRSRPGSLHFCTFTCYFFKVTGMSLCKFWSSSHRAVGGASVSSIEEFSFVQMIYSRWVYLVHPDLDNYLILFGMVFTLHRAIPA